MKDLSLSLAARCDLPTGNQRMLARPGPSPSNRAGNGDELHASRDYILGDDPRRIDWNATARTGDLQVKTTLADVAVNVHLIPLLTGTMRFGTRARKHDVASEALRFVAAVAVRRGEELFLHAANKPALRLTPRRGVVILEDLLQEMPAWTDTYDSAELIRSLGGPSGPSLLVVVLDIATTDSTLRALEEQSGGRDMLALIVHDPSELALPRTGSLWVEDPRSGTRVRVNCSDRRVQEVYAQRAEDRLRTMRERLRSCGSHIIELSTAEEVALAMLHGLPRRR